MARTKTNAHVGSDMDDFFAEEGRLQESSAFAIKLVLAWEIKRVMRESSASYEDGPCGCATPAGCDGTVSGAVNHQQSGGRLGPNCSHRSACVG